MPVFGKILVASQIEEAAIATLQLWIPTYLRQIESVLDIRVGSIPIPEHFSNRNSFDFLPGEKFPKVMAISPGVSGEPLADGSGHYRARWELGIGCVIAAQTEPLANMQAKIYGAACREILLNKPSLGGIATAVTWVDEKYEDLPIPNQNMLLKSASVYFQVDCRNVANRWGGPENPDEEPYSYGQVERVIIDLEKVALDAEI